MTRDNRSHKASARGSGSPDALVIVGSPHGGGRSTALARAVADALRERGVEPTCWHLAARPIAPCVNCGACQTTGDCRIADDSWPELAWHLEHCDLAFLVAPVYFAGPAACLKAMLDRCQMFWARKYVLGRAVPSKRPCHLLVVGDGGDPFGSEPLERICTSALNCANVRVGMQGENIHRFIGAEHDLSRVPGIVGAALGSLGKPQGAPQDAPPGAPQGAPQDDKEASA